MSFSSSRERGYWKRGEGGTGEVGADRGEGRYLAVWPSRLLSTFEEIWHVLCFFLSDFDRISISAIPLSSFHSLSQVGVRADLGRERLNPSIANRRLSRAAILDDVETQVDEEDAKRRRGQHRHGQGERCGGGCRRSGGREEAHFGVSLWWERGKEPVVREGEGGRGGRTMTKNSKQGGR